MIGDPAFFRDLAYILVAAVVGGGLAWRARQPLILGYVLGGLLLSPFTPGPAVGDAHRFELFAEIGVILLMFSIGIELSLRDLLRVKWVAMLGAPLGMALSISLASAVGALLGWPAIQGLVVGMVVSVASTMVMARLLIDRGDLHSRHGRVMIGIALVEDIAVVVLIVLIPTLGTLDAGRLFAVARALGSAALILVPFLYLAAKVMPRVFLVVARTQNEEIFLLVALALAVGTAALTQAVGLSLALGAFLAGLLINQDYAHHALARLLPLRDVFVALFFLTVGALMNPRTVLENLPLLATIVGLVVVGNFLIWTGVARAFGYPLPTALMAGVGLTQIGEFSFILIQVARGAGHVGDDVYNTTLAASLVTILVNAALMRTVPRWIGRAQLARATRVSGRRAAAWARRPHRPLRVRPGRQRDRRSLRDLRPGLRRDRARPGDREKPPGARRSVLLRGRVQPPHPGGRGCRAGRARGHRAAGGGASVPRGEPSARAQPGRPDPGPRP